MAPRQSLCWAHPPDLRAPLRRVGAGVVTHAVGTLQEENHVCKAFTLLALLDVPLEQEGHPKGPFLIGWELGAEAGSLRFLGLIQPQAET